MVFQWKLDNRMGGSRLIMETKYEDIIARFTDTQLIYEQAILNEEETVLYNKKKALKEEFKKRLRRDK